MLEVRGQQGDAWIRARVGRITGSRMADVCNYLQRASGEKKKGDSSAKRDRYRMELIAERLTGRATDHYTSQPMIRGSELENDARMYYEGVMRCMVEPVGFVVHQKHSFSGASADSLIGDSGILEIKCPLPVNHLEYVQAGVVPEDYVPQMQWELACTGRKFCDFVSYCPDILDPKLRFFYRRLDRDEEAIAYYTTEVLKLNAEIEYWLAEREATPIAPFPVEIIGEDEALAASELDRDMEDTVALYDRYVGNRG